MELFKNLPRSQSRWIILAGISGAILLNTVFYMINQILALPIFLDSIFTIVATALLGVWPGLIVGLFSNLLFEVAAGFPGFLYPFAAVNMLTALIVHGFVRAGRFEAISDAILVVIVLALGNAIAGTIIVTVFMGGMTNEPVDSLVRAVVIAGQSLLTSAFVVRILVNVVDKGIGVAVGFTIYKLVQSYVGSGDESVKAMDLRDHTDTIRD